MVVAESATSFSRAASPVVPVAAVPAILQLPEITDAVLSEVAHGRGYISTNHINGRGNSSPAQVTAIRQAQGMYNEWLAGDGQKWLATDEGKKWASSYAHTSSKNGAVTIAVTGLLDEGFDRLQHAFQREFPKDHPEYRGRLSADDGIMGCCTIRQLAFATGHKELVLSEEEFSRIGARSAAGGRDNSFWSHIAEKWQELRQSDIGIHLGEFLSGTAARNNNPGNIKVASGQIGIVPGLVGQDERGFGIFATAEDGIRFAHSYITRMMTGRHSAYSPDMTLSEAFSRYAEGAGQMHVANFIQTTGGASSPYTPFTRLRDVNPADYVKFLPSIFRAEDGRVYTALKNTGLLDPSTLQSMVG